MNTFSSCEKASLLERTHLLCPCAHWVFQRGPHLSAQPLLRCSLKTLKRPERRPGTSWAQSPLIYSFKNETEQCTGHTACVCAGMGEKLPNTGSQAAPARHTDTGSCGEGLCHQPGNFQVAEETEQGLEDPRDVSHRGRRTGHSTQRDGDNESWRVTNNK